MQVSTFVLDAHLLLVVTYDFNEVTHNVREEGNSAKHDKYSNDSLQVIDRKVVAKSNCT